VRVLKPERARVLVLYATALLAIALPIAVALRWAHNQSLQHQQDKALTMAAEVLQRTEQISQQLKDGFEALNRLATTDPCAEEAIAVMRRIVIRSDMLIDFGYVNGNRLLCSSFGHQNVDVGAPSYASTLGYVLRAGVRLPLAQDTVLVLTTDPRSGYTGMLHNLLPLAGIPAKPEWRVGVISHGQRKPIVQRGDFRAEWLLRSEGYARQGSFFDGTDIVGWKQSDHFAYTAYAVLPKSELDQEWRRSILLLLPIGLGAGLLLAAALARLARLQTSMPALLRQALKNNEFSLAYQPIVDLTTGRWVGAEALLRWQRPGGETISPDVFIPIAEQNGLITAVTERVIQLLERDATQLLRQHPNFHIAINLSAEDIGSPRLLPRLCQALDRMGIKPHNLHVEATERVFIRLDETQRVVRSLRAHGMAVAIDDFGTGYSSLSYLTHFELDYLKIDKAFVDTIGTGAVTGHVIAHIIEMGKSLRLKMIAEGVETEAQAAYLREHGVAYAQGWLFAKPMPLDQLHERLAQGGQVTQPPH